MRNAHPRLLAPWLLRDDGDNLLLYKCTYSELKYRVLSPKEALILPFFSGERSYGNIQAIWLHLTKPSDKAASLAEFNKLVRNLIAPDEIIGLFDAPSESFKHKTKIPLPDFSNYRWPAERTSVPVAVLVALTNRCVAECRYCYAERKLGEERTARSGSRSLTSWPVSPFASLIWPAPIRSCGLISLICCAPWSTGISPSRSPPKATSRRPGRKACGVGDWPAGPNRSRRTGEHRQREQSASLVAYRRKQLS